MEAGPGWGPFDVMVNVPLEESAIRSWDIMSDCRVLGDQLPPYLERKGIIPVIILALKVVMQHRLKRSKGLRTLQWGCIPAKRFSCDSHAV